MPTTQVERAAPWTARPQLRHAQGHIAMMANPTALLALVLLASILSHAQTVGQPRSQVRPKPAGSTPPCSLAAARVSQPPLELPSPVHLPLTLGGRACTSAASRLPPACLPPAIQPHLCSVLTPALPLPPLLPLRPRSLPPCRQPQTECWSSLRMTRWLPWRRRTLG